MLKYRYDIKKYITSLSPPPQCACTMVGGKEGRGGGGGGGGGGALESRNFCRGGRSPKLFSTWSPDKSADSC